MAPLAVRELRDLFRILEEHLEWRDELRRHVLADDLLALPQLMRDLTDQVRSLTEAQARTETRVTSPEQALKELADAQRQTQQEVRACIGRGDADPGRGPGSPKDFGLESQFEPKAPAYLGHLLRGTQVLPKEALVRLLDAAVDEAASAARNAPTSC
jgi:hypothetical protein